MHILHSFRVYDGCHYLITLGYFIGRTASWNEKDGGENWSEDDRWVAYFTGWLCYVTHLWNRNVLTMPRNGWNPLFLWYSSPCLGFLIMELSYHEEKRIELFMELIIKDATTSWIQNLMINGIYKEQGSTWL